MLNSTLPSLIGMISEAVSVRCCLTYQVSCNHLNKHVYVPDYPYVQPVFSLFLFEFAGVHQYPADCGPALS